MKHEKDPAPMDPLNIVIFVVVGAVFVVLLLGLVNMMRGGSPQRSQVLMRWRVGLQLLAVVLMVLAVWLLTR